MTTASLWLSILCGRDGLLQCKATFSRYTTISVAICNMGGLFFHPKGKNDWYCY